jgi:hypothetical protein
VTRGNRPEEKKAEDPGALKIYNFRDGQLSPLANLPVGGNGGLGYGPRHLDFHPTQPWVYVSVESQNELHMHRMQGDSLAPEPAYNKRSTVGTYDIRFPQAAGAIHVHPSGRTVYVSNRANATVDFNGKRVFRGGENNIAVFSIDPATGEPDADPERRSAELSHSHVQHRSQRPHPGSGEHRRHVGARGRQRALRARRADGVPHRRRRPAQHRAQVRRRARRQIPVVDGAGGLARCVKGVNVPPHRHPDSDSQALSRDKARRAGAWSFGVHLVVRRI